MQTSTVFLRVTLLALLVSAFVGVPAGVAEENQVRGETAAESMARLLSQVEPQIKAIYETDEFRVRSFEAHWLPDGSGYLKLETPDGESGPEIARYDSASGRATSLTQDGDSDAITNGSARWSPDGTWIVYVQSDSSAVPKRAVLVPGDPMYRTFQETRFERIGGHDPDHYLRTDGDVRPETIPHRLNAATSFQM